MNVSSGQRRLLFMIGFLYQEGFLYSSRTRGGAWGTPHFQTKPRHVWLVWVFPDCSLLLAAPLLPPTARSGSVKLMKCPFIIIIAVHYVFFSDLCFLFIQPTLGVNKSSSALLYVILSPVGPYFKTGTFSPVALLADPSFVRAWPGGCGDCKLGG